MGYEYVLSSVAPGGIEPPLGLSTSPGPGSGGAMFNFVAGCLPRKQVFGASEGLECDFVIFDDIFVNCSFVTGQYYLFWKGDLGDDREKDLIGDLILSLEKERAAPK